MPIINGIYVNDSLPGSKQAQIDVFGEHSRRDMSDYSAAAYNYLMKQQEQAYNLELWNLTNEYNSPSAQMKRYQDAGLNPFLIYGQQNVANAPSGASAASFRTGGTMSKGVQAGLSAIGQIVNTVKAARDTYDYVKYGTESSAWQRNLIREQGQAASLQNMWNRYLLGVDGENSPVADSPRFGMYRYQSMTQEQKYAQLKALVGLIPYQQERTAALKSLDDYRLQILQGQNDAILNIHTGNQTVDSFLRLLGYWLIQQ